MTNGWGLQCKLVWEVNVERYINNLILHNTRALKHVRSSTSRGKYIQLDSFFLENVSCQLRPHFTLEHSDKLPQSLMSDLGQERGLDNDLMMSWHLQNAKKPPTK